MVPTRVVVVLVVCAVVGAGCGGSADGDTRPREGARLQAASQGLCDAQVLVAQGHVREAAEVFDRETHAYLHELADRLRDIDRAATARLLEAKQRLEAAIEDPFGIDPQTVAGLITELQRALAGAAEAADLPMPLCREGAA